MNSVRPALTTNVPADRPSVFSQAQESDESGELRFRSISYAEELRPLGAA